MTSLPELCESCSLQAISPSDHGSSTSTEAAEASVRGEAGRRARRTRRPQDHAGVGRPAAHRPRLRARRGRRGPARRGRRPEHRVPRGRRRDGRERVPRPRRGADAPAGAVGLPADREPSRAPFLDRAPRPVRGDRRGRRARGRGTRRGPRRGGAAVLPGRPDGRLTRFSALLNPAAGRSCIQSPIASAAWSVRLPAWPG